MKNHTQVHLEKLRLFRNKHGYTQEEIGRRLGVAGTSYYHREAGHMPFRADELAILAQLYQQPLESLYLPVMPTYINIGLTHNHPKALEAIQKVLKDYHEIILEPEKSLKAIDLLLNQEGSR